MGLGDRLRAAMRDKAPAPVSMPPRPTQPAQLVGARNSFTLTAEDFEPGKQVPGVKSILASYRVPKDTALIVPRGVPFRMYIPATLEEKITPTGATTLQIPLDFGLAQSVRGADADVQAFVSEDGGATYEEANVTNVNYDANTVTIGKNSSVNAYKVRYLTVAGEVELTAQKPGGSTSVNARQWNGSLRRIHLTDQDQGETALMFMGREPEIQLAPEWRLNLVINSPANFVWEGAEFFIEAHTQRLAVTDAQALNALTEASLR